MASRDESVGHDTASKARTPMDAPAILDVEPHAGKSIVARLCPLLFVVFRDIIQKFRNSGLHDDQKTPTSISLQRSVERLRLWSDGYQICAGGQDIIFIRSGRLKRATIEVLVSISDTLLERLEPLTSSKKPEISDIAEESVRRLKDVLDAARTELDHDTSSSDSSSNYGSDSLEEIAKDLEIDTLSLMGLDALFQSVESHSFAEKAAFADDTNAWLPHEVYAEKIRAKFPRAKGSLIERLSKASYDRYLRCYQKRKTQTAGVDVDFPKTTQSDVNTTFQSSSLRQSTPPFVSIAEAAMHSHAKGRVSFRIPSLSKEAQDGQPFECISCGKFLSVRNSSAWQQHLYQDLLPWQCLELSCPFTDVFATREDWIAHIAHDHKFDPDWKPIICPLCFDKTPSGKIAITIHLGSHLKEISLAAIPRNLSFTDNSRTEQDVRTSKPQKGTNETNQESNSDAPKPNISTVRSASPQRHIDTPVYPQRYPYIYQPVFDFTETLRSIVDDSYTQGRVHLARGLSSWNDPTRGTHAYVSSGQQHHPGARYVQHAEDSERYGVSDAWGTITRFDSQFSGEIRSVVPTRDRVINYPQSNVTPQRTSNQEPVLQKPLSYPKNNEDHVTEESS